MFKIINPMNFRIPCFVIFFRTLLDSWIIRRRIVTQASHSSSSSVTLASPTKGKALMLIRIKFCHIDVDKTSRFRIRKCIVLEATRKITVTCANPNNKVCFVCQNVRAFCTCHTKRTEVQWMVIHHRTFTRLCLANWNPCAFPQMILMHHMLHYSGHHHPPQ